jgi:hypothetical protein
VGAAVTPIEQYGFVIMLHRRAQLAQPAIGIADVILNIGVARVAQRRELERRDRPIPILGDQRLFACREIGVELCRTPAATSAPRIAAKAIDRIILGNRRLRSFQALQPILIASASTLLLAGEECLGFLRFRPLGIGILRQVHELAVVLSCLRSIARRIRGTGNAQERAVAVWCLLE